MLHGNELKHLGTVGRNDNEMIRQDIDAFDNSDFAPTNYITLSIQNLFSDIWLSNLSSYLTLNEPSARPLGRNLMRKRTLSDLFARISQRQAGLSFG